MLRPCNQIPSVANRIYSPSAMHYCTPFFVPSNNMVVMLYIATTSCYSIRPKKQTTLLLFTPEGHSSHQLVVCRDALLFSNNITIFL